VAEPEAKAVSLEYDGDKKKDEQDIINALETSEGTGWYDENGQGPPGLYAVELAPGKDGRRAARSLSDAGFASFEVFEGNAVEPRAKFVAIVGRPEHVAHAKSKMEE
jgi:hypothetical protein